jgi:hypothetical protein
MPQAAEMLTLQGFQGGTLHYQRGRKLWQGRTTKSGTSIKKGIHYNIATVMSERLVKGGSGIMFDDTGCEIRIKPIAKRQFCNSNGVGRLHRACRPHLTVSGAKQAASLEHRVC